MRDLNYECDRQTDGQADTRTDSRTDRRQTFSWQMPRRNYVVRQKPS